MESGVSEQYSIQPVQAQVSILPTTVPTAQELMVYQTWAKNAYESQMYRNVGKESAIMMIMLAAREYGIGPAQALNGGLHIIEGKVELSARMMSALIRKAKHQLKITDGPDFCIAWGKRRDTGEEHEVKYTIEMAQRAGLIKDKGGWKKNAEDMLYNRAMSRLARRLFSDVIGIGYIEGEISDPKGSNEALESLPYNKSSDIEQYMELFHNDDKLLASDFFDAVQKHFGWGFDETLTNLMCDAELMGKFHKWKTKKAQKNEISNVIAAN